jgi:RNA polymerase sigma-70 factor (ECF subfamily)
MPSPEIETTLVLLERVKAGDRDALERLFARCLPPLRRWASGRLPASARHLADTQDLVQEAVLHTFSKIGTFEARRPGALQAYLRQAVINRIRDELRRPDRRLDLLETDRFTAADLSPLEEAIGREATERYEQALARLRPEEREVLVARIEFGYTYEEVADVVGKPTADAARKAARRAILRLVEEMKSQGR